MMDTRWNTLKHTWNSGVAKGQTDQKIPVSGILVKKGSSFIANIKVN